LISVAKMIRSSLQALGRQVLAKSLPNYSPASLNCGPKLLCKECKNTFVPLISFSTQHDDQIVPPPTSVKEYLAQHEISISDSSAPPPCLTFESTGLPEYLLSKLQKNFSAPTPIQAQGLPIAMSGKNMVGIGQTGSGKTLAFLLPAILHIRAERERMGSSRGVGEGPLALVLAPTRELAKQIEEVAIEFRRLAQIKTVCCIGGEARGRQLSFYDAGAELMIATPGRINDFLESGDMQLKNVGFIVMDEADRMLDMGFEPQVRSVLESLKEERQTMMFSATWPEEVQELASEFLGEFTFMKIGSVELCANKNINQEVVVTTKDYKQENFLIDMEEKLSRKKVLVFTERKATVDRLERLMRNRRLKAMGIHGDKSQRMRSDTLQRFKDGTCKVMIATDVAARGLDVTDVDWVVNYDFPNDIENYIHRIGRTGRASKKGNSLTYMTLDDARFAGKLIKILNESKQEVPEELVELQKEERSVKAKGKLGKMRDQGIYRQRRYSYRGMGRDEGYEGEDEEDWGRGGYRSRSSGTYGGRREGGYNRKGGSDYGREEGLRRTVDPFGFENDKFVRSSSPWRSRNFKDEDD